jgi:hypothetical protein
MVRQGDTTFQDQAVILPKIKTGLYASRDLSVASGTQAITGLGYTPSFVMCHAQVDQQDAMSIGFQSVVGVSQGSCITDRNSWTANAWAGQGVLIWIYRTSPNYAYAYISSFDTDGFTLTWVKANSPTGTLDMYFNCFK